MRRSSIAACAALAIATVYFMLAGRSSYDGGVDFGTDAVKVRGSPRAAPQAMPEAATAESRLIEPPPADAISDPEPCSELLRLGIVLSPDEEYDTAACTRTLLFVSRGRVPALPGLAGFEVRDTGEQSPRKMLFDEPDNPDWARLMEGRVLQEIAELIDFPLTTLHAVCRSSTCGLLFVYDNANYHGGSYNYYAEELADKLGFNGFHGGHTRAPDGTGFTFIYLGAWSTARTAF